MTSSLINAIKTQQSYTLTENGALALNTTGDALVDLFAVAGALRQRPDNDITSMYDKALIEDELLAAKLAFYTRDVREGLGERRTGRLMLKRLAQNKPEVFAKNVGHIAEYGRYDDLVYLLDVAPKVIMPVIQKQLNDDIKNMADGKPVSLLAKWLPSVNTSNKAAVKKGRYIAKALGMSEREYRKTLAGLRSYLKVVEVDMSAKNYGGIVYGEVPSRAMTNYRQAFMRNDGERFKAYLERVKKGDDKINSSVLYPYDIVEKFLYGNIGDDEVLEQQWRSLPDYCEGNRNFLVMADVSGSMWGRPMATSVGLALYFAERNKGPFANAFMTFSINPELVTIKGDTLRDKLMYIQNSDWGGNTDLEAAFDLVLSSAMAAGTPAADMPDSIVVITDMEFDVCANPNWLFYDALKAKYAAAGYDMPNIVFWNVASRNDTFHASFDKKGVQLASGQSASVFATLTSGVQLTPHDYMVSVLNNERYAQITV